LLDVALVRLTNKDADVSPAALLARIERLERASTPATTEPTAARARNTAAASRAELGARARRPEPGPGATPTTPTVSAPPIPPPAPTPAVDAPPFPSRDALTLAWADHVVPRLKGM